MCGIYTGVGRRVSGVTQVGRRARSGLRKTIEKADVYDAPPPKKNKPNEGK